MYHVIGTAIAVSVLYSISYLFYRIGVFPLKLHRKIWNTILAITFLITAPAGLFLALQINYKWDMPFVTSVLKWHVETGAGFSITGIFHLIWHLKYFTKIFDKNNENSIHQEYPENSPSKITLNLFVTGFVSMSVQILLLRELLNISGGYELNSGTFLASWLITSAIGAFTAGGSSLNDLRKINIVFSLSPMVSLILLILLARMFLQPGETPSFLVSLIFTFLVLIPFCLISGFTFIKLLAAARHSGGIEPGKSFSIETTGGIMAGVLLTVLTAGIINTYKLLLIIILLSVSYTLLNWLIKTGLSKMVVKTALALAAAIIIFSDPDILFKRLLLPGVKVTSTTDTPYGNLTFGEYGGERSVYYNHQLINYSDDVIEREEDIHYALLQTENPENVMIISGQLHSHLPELIKYPVKKVVFVERDPELVKLQSNKADPGNIELVVENKDAFRYIKGKEENYDAVILLLPPPSTLSLNRYYTSEFFREVREKTGSDGIFMCSPGIWDNYPNQESINLFSSVYNSLKDVFVNVVPIVGNKLYFLASDSELSSSVCDLAVLRGTHNIYVGPDYLSDDLIKTKSDEVVSLIDREVKINTIAFPVSTFHFQSYFISRNLNEKIPAFLIMILLFVIPMVKIRRESYSMYFSAASLAGFEIIVLLSIQLAAGNMYQLTGMILAVFMSGLAAGSYSIFRVIERVPLKIKMLSIVIWYFIIALIINHLLSAVNPLSAILIIVISILPPSYMTGSVFRELTIKDNNGLVSARTYGADLAGSALGFIVISGLVLPLLGIKASIFLLSGLILTGILFGTNRNL